MIIYHVHFVNGPAISLSVSFWYSGVLYTSQVLEGAINPEKDIFSLVSSSLMSIFRADVRRQEKNNCNRSAKHFQWKLCCCYMYILVLKIGRPNSSLNAQCFSFFYYNGSQMKNSFCCRVDVWVVRDFCMPLTFLNYSNQHTTTIRRIYGTPRDRKGRSMVRVRAGVLGR